MLNRLILTLTLSSVAALFGGCGKSDTSSDEAEGKYRLASEPDGAQDVIAVRKSAKDGDEVVIVGRIGGGEKPFVEDIAAFSIIDRSLKPCNELEGDMCPTPWDYCCDDATTLANAKALIRIVDEQGNLVKGGAKKLINVKELDTVVVRGTAKRDKDQNLTIVAQAVYVRQK
jgi:hypothetical protein